LEAQKSLLTKDKQTAKTWIGAAAALGAVGISLAAYHTLNAQETAEIMAAEPAAPPAAPPPAAAPVAGATETEVASANAGFEAGGETAASTLAADPEAQLGVDALETENLNQYIEENYSIEDELLSMIGMIPDQLISLTLERKMDVFASLIRSV